MTQIFRVLFWAVCVAVTILSLLPGDYLPSSAFDWWDKAQHALAFLVLCGLGLLAYSSRSTQVVVGLLAYGVLIELAQAATGWRYGDWQDWVADAVGVGAAYTGWYLWKSARCRGYIFSPNSSSLPDCLLGRDV